MVSRPGLRVFLDTNVLFSGLYADSGAPRRILDASVDRFTPVISTTVLEELVRNLRRKAPSALTRLEQVFREAAFEMARAPSPVQAKRYEEFGSDAPVVGAAALAQVDYFCTGDKRLITRLRSNPLGCPIVTPAELAALLSTDV